MDQAINLNGTHSSIDLDQVLVPAGNEKKKVARKRWALLARALKVCFIHILTTIRAG